jgi:branched-chain amino acid transport system permease protein
MIEFFQTAIGGALTGLVYGLVALSFIVIYRAARIVNLAQGELIVLGGFFVWSFAAGLHFPLLLSLPLALLATAACGIILERVIFRPLVGQSSFAIVMATIALLILLRGLEQAVWGAETRAYPEILPRGSLHLGPFLINRALLIGAAGTLLVTEVLNWWFLHTREGLRLAAVAEDHFTALSMGVSVKRAATIAWVLGSVLACLASVVLLSGRLLSVSAADIGFVALPVALLGGMESLRGAPLAGLLVGVGEALSSAYLDPLTNGAMSRLFPFVLMVAVLLVRPQGLFGWRVIERL